MSEITEKYSYGVAMKPEGKIILYRFLLIALYVLLPIGGVVLMIAFPGLVVLGAFLVLADAVLIFFTWRFVSYDYEYTVESGKVSFTVVHNAFNHRIPKHKTDFMLKDCTAIEPYNNDQYPDSMKKYMNFGAETIYNAISCSKAEDKYFAIYTDAEGKKCAFLFQATGDMLKRCRWYNKEATIVSQTRI